jgi:ATP-dependent Clp protease adaptor protein ClpS
MPTDKFEDEGLAITEIESTTKLRKPPLYKVLIHNDDFTSMEFVVFILQNVFGRSESEAIRLMLNVHNEGVGIAGVYPYEIAEMKVVKVTNLAQANEFPLLCTIEEADNS